MARIKDFIDTTDFTKKELVEMIDLGIAIKKCTNWDIIHSL